MIFFLFGLTSGEAAPVEAPVPVENTGGWWMQYEREVERQRSARLERAQAHVRIQRLRGLDRKLAETLRKTETEREKREELERVTALVKQYRTDIEALGGSVMIAAERAITLQTYSTMEALDRELRLAREEELFLLQALAMVINA